MTQQDNPGGGLQDDAGVAAEQAEIKEVLSAGLSGLVGTNSDTDPDKDPKAKAEEDPDPKSAPEKKTPDSEEEPEKKSEEDPEKKPEKDSEEGEDEDSLKDFLEEGDPVKIPTRKQRPVMTEKDYRIGQDGKVEVFAEHLNEDIINVRDKDARIFLKIYSAKNGRDKAEVIAKSLGFEADSTRTAGQYARDVISSYIDAHRKGDQEKVNDIYTDLFPDALKNKDDQNFSFVGEKAEKDDVEKDEDSPVSDLPYKKQEIQDAVSRFVDRNLYRHLEKGASAEDAEKVRTELSSKILENSKIFLALKQDRFDPKTGKKVSAEEAIELAFNEVFSESDSSKKKSDPPIGGGSGQQQPNGGRDKKEVETEEIRSILTKNLGPVTGKKKNS